MKNDSLLEIKNILEEEANILARKSDGVDYNGHSHRIAIAITREIQRLRRLAGDCAEAIERSYGRSDGP